MKLRYSGMSIFALLVVILSVLSSCKEEWDNHYYATPANKSSLNLYQFIQSREDLQTFTKMLQIAGYDSILSQSQTYTVWAPVNSALEKVNLLDTLEVTRIVTNHISRYSHPSADVSKSQKIYKMMNNKLLSFYKNSGIFYFSGKMITESDLATQNGILHILGDYSAYKKNFWEFINETDDLDSVRNYISSLTTYVLDEEKSYDADNILVDSIFKRSNIILDYYAQLESEDSIYTVIYPTNAAWTKSYDEIYPYFKTPASEGGEAQQQEYAKSMIVRDLFFKGRIDVPVGKDTLTSTFGNQFTDPDNLFAGATKSDLSNGNCYVTNQLNYKPSESWLQKIIIQAERSRYVTASNYSISAVPGYGTGLDISNGYYLRAYPTSTSDLSSLNSMFLRFELPNTLSTKYNVYCVFVPNTDTIPSKVKFFLSYMDADGNQTKDLAVDIDHKLTTSTTISKAGVFENDPTKMDKVLVLENFELPYANILTFNPETYTYSPTTLFLRVNNAAKIKESDYTRTLQIDCIILEPVQ